jgi:hypothetical protein
MNFFIILVFLITTNLFSQDVKCLEGSKSDILYNGISKFNDNYFLQINSNSSDGFYSENEEEKYKRWLVCLDSDRNEKWKYLLANSDESYYYSILPSFYYPYYFVVKARGMYNNPFKIIDDKLVSVCYSYYDSILNNDIITCKILDINTGQKIADIFLDTIFSDTKNPLSIIDYKVIKQNNKYSVSIKYDDAIDYLDEQFFIKYTINYQLNSDFELVNKSKFEGNSKFFNTSSDHYLLNIDNDNLSFYDKTSLYKLDSNANFIFKDSFLKPNFYFHIKSLQLVNDSILFFVYQDLDGLAKYCNYNFINYELQEKQFSSQINFNGIAKNILPDYYRISEYKNNMDISSESVFFDDLVYPYSEEIPAIFHVDKFGNVDTIVYIETTFENFNVINQSAYILYGKSQKYYFNNLNVDFYDDSLGSKFHTMLVVHDTSLQKKWSFLPPYLIRKDTIDFVFRTGYVNYNSLDNENIELSAHYYSNDENGEHTYFDTIFTLNLETGALQENKLNYKNFEVLKGNDTLFIYSDTLSCNEFRDYNVIIKINKLLLNNKENIEVEKVNVWPNPANKFIELDSKIELDYKNCIYIIFDSKGEIIVSQTLNYNRIINIENLAKGMYYLILYNDKRQFSSKFIKI